MIKRNEKTSLIYDEYLDSENTDNGQKVGWGSNASQRRRFEIFVETFDFNNKTILDLGCGRGCFNLFLKEKGIKHKYLGCDINTRMVKEACRRTGLPSIYSGDLTTLYTFLSLQEIDVVVASGIFAFDVNGGYEYIESVLSGCHALASSAVLANFLSNSTTSKVDPEFYVDPKDLLGIGSKITKYYALRHDYQINDCTLLLLHKESK